MRPKGGGGIGWWAIVLTVALSACVAAPTPDRPALRVLPGGGGVAASPTPSATLRPEPPIGVIMSGRVVLACDMGARCAYFARLVRLYPEAPDPTAPPDGASAATVTLVGVDAAIRGYGPTARTGRTIDSEPKTRETVLIPGAWRIEAWTTSIGTDGTSVPATQRATCALDFVVAPGEAIGLRLAPFESGCRIGVTPPAGDFLDR